MSKKAKETVKKKEKRVQENWVKLTRKYPLLNGVFLIQTIGSVIKAINVMKNKKKTDEMTQEEKVRIYRMLKINRPIVKMLSKAHMESLRRKQEEEELEKQKEDLINDELPDPNELSAIEKNRQKEINDKADNAFKVKPKVLNNSDLPKIESKLKKLYEMKEKEGDKEDKAKNQILDDYIEELQRDKNAILDSLGKKASKRVLERIQNKFSTLNQKYEKERKILELADIAKLKKNKNQILKL